MAENRGKTVNSNVFKISSINIKIENDLEAEEETTVQSLLPSSTFDSQLMIKNEPEVSYDLIKLEKSDDEKQQKQSTKKKKSIKKPQIKIFSCDKCSIEFTSKVQLNNHRIVHIPAHLVCKKCGAKFKKSYAFKNHECLHCSFCKKLFYDRRSFKRHQIAHTGPTESSNPYICDYCGKNIKIRLSIIRHVMEHCHDAKIKCEVCGKMWKTNIALKQHLKKAHSTSLVKCKECGKELKQPCLYGHMKSVHSDKTHKCPDCQSSFKTLSKLNEHQKIHNKKFHCKICDRKFANGYEFKQHQMFHENPNAFSCKVCKKSFQNSTSLMTHLKSHNLTKFRNLQCDLCIFITHRKESLRYHINAHIKRNAKLANVKKACRCPKCGLMFKSKWSLWGHSANVHPKEKCKCDICGVETKTKESMKEHLLTKHLKSL